jgi:hypothetical protein
VIQSILDRLTGHSDKARIAELEAVVSRLTAELAQARQSALESQPVTAAVSERTFPAWKSFRARASWADKKAAAEFERNQSARRVAAAAKQEEELRNGVHNEIGQDVQQLSNRESI